MPHIHDDLAHLGADVLSALLANLSTSGRTTGLWCTSALSPTPACTRPTAPIDEEQPARCSLRPSAAGVWRLYEDPQHLPITPAQPRSSRSPRGARSSRSIISVH